MHYFSWQLACPGRWERSLAQRPGAQVHLSLWGRGGQTRRDAAQHSETRLLLGRPLRSQEKRPFSCVPSWPLKGPGILSPGTPCTRTSGAGAAGGRPCCRWREGQLRLLLQRPSPPGTPSCHLSLDFRYLATSSFSPKGFGNNGGIAPGHLRALKRLEPTTASRAFPSLLRAARSLFPPTGPKRVGPGEVVLAFGPRPLTAHPSVQLSWLSDRPLCRGTFLTSRAGGRRRRSPRPRTHKPAHPTPHRKQPPTASTHAPWPRWPPRLRFPSPGRCRIPDVEDTVLTHVRPRGSGNWWARWAPPRQHTRLL